MKLTAPVIGSESIATIVRGAFDAGDATQCLPNGSDGARLTVCEINDLAQLLPLADPWNALLAQTQGASYFSSYDWFVVYWRHFGGDQRMRVLAVTNDERIVGIVPLIVTPEPTRLGRLRSMRYPLHGWGSSYGPIGAETELVLRTALRHVAATPRDWDLLDMLWIDRDGVDQGATARAMASVGLRVTESPWLTSARIDLREGWQAYWGLRKTHFRTNLRAAERKLAQTGAVSFVRYRPLGATVGEADPRWDLYDQCLKIATESWQGASRSGTTLSHESIRRFLREAHQRAAAFGGVDVNLLFVGGRPAAFGYNYHYAGYVYGLRAGFLSDFPGAGNVLMRRMIEDSCHRGDHTFDLGPGTLSVKRQWQTHLATAWRCTHYSRTPRAQILRGLHALKRAT